MIVRHRKDSASPWCYSYSLAATLTLVLLSSPPRVCPIITAAAAAAAAACGDGESVDRWSLRSMITAITAALHSTPPMSSCMQSAVPLEITSVDGWNALATPRYCLMVMQQQQQLQQLLPSRLLLCPWNNSHYTRNRMAMMYTVIINSSPVMLPLSPFRLIIASIVIKECSFCLHLPLLRNGRLSLTINAVSWLVAKGS